MSGVALSAETTGLRRRPRWYSIVAAAALASLVVVALPFHAVADSVTETIAGAGGSTAGNNVAVSPDRSKIYTADGGANTVSVIDTSTNSVTATIPAAGGPTSVVVSPDGSRLYVTLGGTASVLVINTATGATVATIPVGPSPVGIAISPDGSRVYAGNVTSPTSVSVIDTSTNTVVAAIPVPSPRNLKVSPDGNQVYVAQYSPGSHGVAVIDTATNTVATTIATDGAGLTNAIVGLAFSPDGTRLYGATRGAGTVTVIDPATDTIVGSIPVGSAPTSVSVTPDGARAYVTNSGDDTVSVIDLATNTVVDTIMVGDNPTGINITPDGLHAYVNNATGRTVSVIDLDTFPTITTTMLPDGTDGTSYTASIATTGSPAPQVSVTAGTFPPGLTLDPATGDITGTPAGAGTYTFTVTAASTVSGIPASVTRDYTITVAAVLPSAPLSLTARLHDADIDLSWSAPATSGSSPITGYRIERSIDGGDFAVLVADTGSTDTTYTDATVDAGHSYTYRVLALTADGAGTLSNTATVTVPASTATPTPTPNATTPADADAGGAQLPDTGAEYGPQLIAGGIGLLLMGTFLVLFVGRRRRALTPG